MRSRGTVIHGHGVAAVAALAAALLAATPVSRPADLPELASDAGGEFRDLAFRIDDQASEADGGRAFRAYATHKGRRVGVTVVLGAQWKSVSPGFGLPAAYSGVAQVRSLGAESDALVGVIDTRAGKLELNEKASDYRRPIVRALAARSPGKSSAGKPSAGKPSE